MIRLFEYEGKALLARNGVPVPSGSLFPELPSCGGRLVVKAQVLSGGRGKAGGIQFATNASEVGAVAATLIGKTLGSALVESVYVEECLDIAREYYLCAMVDRDDGQPLILASPEGGVDIEEVPAEKILRRKVDPLIGLRPYVVDEVVRFLAPPEEAADQLRAVVVALYQALEKEDAELLEINPLVLTAAGLLVAADAKCVLDEDASYRQRAQRRQIDGTPFEVAARNLGTIGIEFEGNIAAIMNGAGMTMATLDQLVSLGGRIRALVELHGAMAHGPERIAEVIRLVNTLNPKVLLLNFYFQFRPLDTIASGLHLATQRGWLPPTCRVVVRFRGEREQLARSILKGLDCTVVSSFEEACKLTVRHATTAADSK